MDGRIKRGMIRGSTVNEWMNECLMQKQQTRGEEDDITPVKIKDNITIQNGDCAGRWLTASMMNSHWNTKPVQQRRQRKAAAKAPDGKLDMSKQEVPDMMSEEVPLVLPRT